MKHAIWIAAAFGAALSMQGLSAEEQAEPGFAKGIVTDQAGKPISGAIVFLDGVLDQNQQQTTKADGTYRMRLQPGAYKAMAWFYAKYEGQSFKVDLKPDSTDTFDDHDGAIRNFTWTLTGEKVPPDMGSYGAFVYVNVATDNMYVEDTEHLHFTLTPKGPLIDGSEGQVIQRDGGAPRTAEYGKILDIPAGRYVITGTYTPEGQPAQTLRFRNVWARKNTGYSDALEFVIEAEGNYCSNCASLEVESPKPPPEQGQ
ncbi:MAG: carboxypeptidase regulatory-like domain-containing protein [Alphaproteobacteria bacterium]|nr:carboxypeptidase regulatory-like domain-containing protein [Alphaproteobacteria bacterium]